MPLWWCVHCIRASGRRTIILDSPKPQRSSFSQYFLSFPSVRNRRTSPSFNSACKRRNSTSPDILFVISRHSLSSAQNLLRRKFGLQMGRIGQKTLPGYGFVLNLSISTMDVSRETVTRNGSRLLVFSVLSN